MKNTLLMVSLIVSFHCILSSQSEVKFTNYNQGMNQIIQSDIKDGEIAILGINEKLPSSKWIISKAIRYTPEKIISYPNTIEYEYGSTKMVSTTLSRIRIDSNSNIWVSGLSLYKLTENKIEEFFVNDTNRAFREYTQFCIDKFNNIWVATQVYRADKYYFSEFYKFDGKNFTKIFQSPSPFGFSGFMTINNSMAALPNGNVLAHRHFVYTEKEVQDSSLKDMMIFNQDGDIVSEWKIKNSFDTTISMFNHHIDYIYLESATKYWIGFSYYLQQWSDGTTKDRTPCITLIDGDNYIEYNSSKGLPLESSSAYVDTYSMSKFSDSKYFFLGRWKFYFLDVNTDNYLHVKTLNDVFTTKEFISFGQNSPEYFQTLIDFFQDTTQHHGGNDVRNIHKLNDNQFVLVRIQGLMLIQFKEANINEYEFLDNQISITFDGNIISINSEVELDAYEVFDINGRTIKKGDLKNKYIEMEDSYNGVFFIKITDFNNNYKAYKFIKIK